MKLFELALLSSSFLFSGSQAGRFLDALPNSLPPKLPARSVCTGNTATTRSQWCDFAIDTDYSETAPDTGITREYWLDITDVTVAPDGVSRPGIAVNGSIPGPTLFADWGDTVVVHVSNSITTSKNGTSIHFHGVRQNYTNPQDGVASITQCPTAPGESMTYTWRAVQYGTSWYHSHFSLQAWEGVFGGIVINGPATADYDEDLGVLFLNDWDHSTVDELYTYAETNGPPTLANGLINGTNTYGDEGGERFNVTFMAGTSYRMRLINGAVDTHWKFSIDNHTLTVIAADFVPVEPFQLDYLNIGIGQRYDVIITADQADVANNFWMRAIPQAACSDNSNSDDIKGIVTYAGADSATPTTTGWDYTDNCDDETPNLVPYVTMTVGDSTSVETSEDAGITINSANLFKWTFNSTSLLTDWANPTLAKVLSGNTTTTSFDTGESVIELSEANTWVYVVVETELAVTHPIHLHGHDVFVLAQAGSATWNSSVDLNLDNPPRRDVVMLPASGYVVLAWQTDNPGIWLMHCHIGWHQSMGLGVQFLERADEISSLFEDTNTADTFVSDQCTAWSAYQAAQDIEQDDSGI
ncbi:multicopper oxidase [Xylariales sp. PMI_506]|nr:multicopper oxidase [Xylariales sp. PMI_506]